MVALLAQGQSDTIRAPFMRERNLFDELLQVKDMVGENVVPRVHEDDSGLNLPAS